jgi:hypothetical protein
MAAYPNPLNEQDLANLNTLCQSCHGTEQMIQDYKECGIPCEEQEHANAMQKKLAEAIKRKFFPYNP